jgi:streptogramin lyase
VEDVDLATGHVRLLGRLPGVRSHAVAVALGGAVWVLGGRIANQPDAAIHRIDPRTGGVTVAGFLPAGVRDAAVVATGPKDAYLLGGARSAPVVEVVHLHLSR